MEDHIAWCCAREGITVRLFGPPRIGIFDKGYTRVIHILNLGVDEFVNWDVVCCKFVPHNHVLLPSTLC